MTSAYKDRQGALTGRGEHTDSVSHSATWHLQVAGTKVWTIRPTEELMSTEELERSSVANGDTLTVVVSPIYLGFSLPLFFSFFSWSYFILLFCFGISKLLCKTLAEASNLQRTSSPPFSGLHSRKNKQTKINF